MRLREREDSPAQFSGKNTNHQTRTDYRLPDNSGVSRLAEGIVQTGRRGIIRPDELTNLAAHVDANKAIKALPPDLSEDDFIGTLMLSLLTECATNSYAQQFVRSSTRYNQPWLGRFTEEVWVPDELMHHLPFKTMLMQLGFSEENLNQDIKDAQETDYVHKAGSTPAHLTTFGMIQEFLTDYWYGLQRRILMATSPEAAHMVARVKQRETLHTLWYRDMTALQVEENPELIAHVAETSTRFQMPGNVIAPELQSKTTYWLPRMGADFEMMKQDLIKLTAEIVRTPNSAGRLVMEVAAQQGLKLGPIGFDQINTALNKFGRPGYGLLGEAFLESAGVKRPFQDFEQGVVEKIRGVLRSYLAHQIDSRLASKAVPVQN